MENKIKYIDSPFEHLLDMFILEQKKGYAKLGVFYRKELANPYGYFHGGFLATLADTASALALMGMDLPQPILTGELKIRYKSPSAASQIYCLAESTQIKYNLYESRVKIFDKEDKLIAEAKVKSFLPNWNQQKKGSA